MMVFVLVESMRNTEGHVSDLFCALVCVALWCMQINNVLVFGSGATIGQKKVLTCILNVFWLSL